MSATGAGGNMDPEGTRDELKKRPTNVVRAAKAPSTWPLSLSRAAASACAARGCLLERFAHDLGARGCRADVGFLAPSKIQEQRRRNWSRRRNGSCRSLCARWVRRDGTTAVDAAKKPTMAPSQTLRPTPFRYDVQAAQPREGKAVDSHPLCLYYSSPTVESPFSLSGLIETRYLQQEVALLRTFLSSSILKPATYMSLQLQIYNGCGD